MFKENFYAKAKEAFEKPEIGEKTSVQDLADRVGAQIYEDRKKVAAFLSQQVSRGRAKKRAGEGRSMFYEKTPPHPGLMPVVQRPFPPGTEPGTR